jgi:hypothetical protein
MGGAACCCIILNIVNGLLIGTIAEKWNCR